MININRRNFLLTSLECLLFLMFPPKLCFGSTKVKGIYAPGWRAVSKTGIDNLVNFANENNINTFMINVKNVRGELFYPAKNSLAKKIDCQVRTAEGSKRSLYFDYLMEQADKNNIRLIARHAMFWDNNLYDGVEKFRLWMREHKRFDEKWVDLRKDEVIDYNLELLQEEQKLGFDEIVLDYIRFPDTNRFGNSEEKCCTIDKIVEKASKAVSSIDFSVQVFGYAAWDYRKAGVGQRVQTLSPHVDIIYPMVYPSHFWPGSLGFENPVEHPYEFVSLGYKEAVKKVKDNTKIMPMIQAFGYLPKNILSQIKAVYDNNMPGFVCWNPTGKYEVLGQAMKLYNLELAESFIN